MAAWQRRNGVTGGGIENGMASAAIMAYGVWHRGIMASASSSIAWLSSSINSYP